MTTPFIQWRNTTSFWLQTGDQMTRLIIGADEKHAKELFLEIMKEVGMPH